MKYSLILLSAGKGVRFGKNTPKQYLLLAGKPMIIHTLERIEKIPSISEIVIVCENTYVNTIKQFLINYGITKKVVFVEGGSTRQQSVYNGLKLCNEENVIIHEAARPLVTINDFNKLINCLNENVSFTYDIPYTVLKKEDEYISDILNRQELVNIQLPQKFNKKDLIFSHEKATLEDKKFTEDASLLYYYTQKPIYCLQGKSYNIKITEYVDLLYGEMLIKEDLIAEEYI